VDELKRQTAMLDDDVKQLTKAVHRISSRADRADRDKRWLVVGLLLVIGLVGLVGFVAFRAENTARVAAATAAAQEQLRAEVLCPLYGIFIGAYDPHSRDNNPDPDAGRKYEDAYQKIRRGWSVMQCTDPIVPPRTAG
jgi:hypothetical protein